jgi:hypothetical protein
MDGSFACPECGSLVEVEGLAPGRQVRCDFCQQLLEVPYLPRVPAGPWKRRRFGRSKWITWTVGVLGAILAVLFVVGGLQYVKKRFRAVEKGAIQKLIESSRSHEASGRLGQALIELDVALDLARKAGSVDRSEIEEQQRMRGDLARRDARAVLDELMRRSRPPLPLGEWLNLVARATKDADLASLKPDIDEQFRAKVRLEAETVLTLARKSFESGSVVESLQDCDRIAKLLNYLRPEVESIVRHDTEELVGRLIATHGVVVESPKGKFVYGSQESYLSSMLPVLLKAMEKKKYLPYRPTSPWSGQWTKALYRLRLDVSERLEDHYLTSENRLTRIEAHLTLTSQHGLIWQTIPTARTVIPIPGMPAYIASRLAATGVRSEESERMLYKNARDHIQEKFGYALNNMPACH